MVPALWISKTGLDAQQTNISVASNNLANASTVGFKKGRAIFEDLLYQNVHQPGGRSSADTTLPAPRWSRPRRASHRVTCRPRITLWM